MNFRNFEESKILENLGNPISNIFSLKKVEIKSKIAKLDNFMDNQEGVDGKKFAGCN